MAVRGNTMTSQLSVVLVALSAAILGCSQSRPTTPRPDANQAPAGNQVPAGGKTPPSAQTPPEAKDPPGTWQTVKGTQDDESYTLQLPPGWKWDQDGLADNTSFSRTLIFKVRASKAYTKESTDDYAKKRLEDLRSDYKKEKGKIRDQRIIKVGGVSAAWLVFAVDSGDGLPSPRMLTHCYLRTRGCDIELSGELLDIRPRRKESDVAASQEDFLKITQSFRLTSVKEAKGDGD